MSISIEHLPPSNVIEQVLKDLEITVEHTKDCIAETKWWLENDGMDDPELTDLTHVPFVTIDNPDSRDLDQALHIERREDAYRVRYALADASYYIQPDSALFTEALSRGTTYYTPSMAAAMLPTDLSEGLISLNPLVDRRAVVFDMLVDSTGAVLHTGIIRGKIQSHAKLNYEGVQQWLDSGQKTSAPYDPSLLLLKEVGNILIQAGEKRGVVQFDRTETRIRVAEDPARFVASTRERFDTERYNEQISLICNMQGAELLLSLDSSSDSLQAIFRVHQAPLKKSLKELKQTLDAFAALQADQADTWRWKHEQSLADYLDSLPDDAANVRRVRAVQRQIMHAQRASTFQPEAGEHHALKTPSYARFSSPMREVVGIFTHKELFEALGKATTDSAADIELRKEVIEAANAARQKQRQLDKKIEFATLSSEFSRELNSNEAVTHTGTILGMRRDRLYINLDDKALDIKLYVDDIELTYPTSYTIGSVAAVPIDASQPRWELGDAVNLQLTGYDKKRSRFRFTLLKA